MRNKTIYEQSKDKNIIWPQFIVWKSHKQSLERNDGDRGRERREREERERERERIELN